MAQAPKKSGQSHSRRMWMASSIGPFDNAFASGSDPWETQAASQTRSCRFFIYIFFWGGALGPG